MIGWSRAPSLSELADSTASAVLVVAVLVVAVPVVVGVAWATTTDAVVVAAGLSFPTVPVRLVTSFGLPRPRCTAYDRCAATVSAVDGPRSPRRGRRPSDRPGPPRRAAHIRPHTTVAAPRRRPCYCHCCYWWWCPDDRHNGRRDSAAAGRRASPRRPVRSRGDPVRDRGRPARRRRRPAVRVCDTAVVRPRSDVSVVLAVRPSYCRS